MPENADQDKQCNDWLLGVGPDYCSSVTTTPVEVLVLSATHLAPPADLPIACLSLKHAWLLLSPPYPSSCSPHQRGPVQLVSKVEWFTLSNSVVSLPSVAVRSTLFSTVRIFWREGVVTGFVGAKGL